MYNKSSIFYNNLPKTYEPLVGTTNVTVTRDNVTWNPISTQKTIYETYKTGLILVESGKVNNNWYKVFSITNGQYSYDSLQYYGNTPSVFTFYNLDVWIVTIVKSSGMPNDPYWLASVDDGPDSKVSVDTQYPVTCAWLRKYFPNQPYSELKACAESIAPNGMPYYVAEMMKYDPADPTDTFRIALDFEDGKPRPRVDIRSYRFQNFGFLIYVHCKKNLSDLDWTPCTEYSEAEQYNFFKAVLVNTHE